MRVWVWPEREYREIGARRWKVSWYTARPGAPEGDDLDFDRDLIEHSAAYGTRSTAMRTAKRRAGQAFFGVAHIREQVVDWISEADGTAEWSDVGELEEVHP